MTGDSASSSEVTYRRLKLSQSLGLGAILSVAMAFMVAYYMDSGFGAVVGPILILAIIAVVLYFTEEP